MEDTLKPLSDAQRRRAESALDRVEMLARVLEKQVSHVSFEELRSAGYEGLVEAAQRYDPASGVPFPGFAHHRIRGAMIDIARRASPAIRRRSRALKVLEATQALLQDAQKNQARRGGADTRTLAERVQAAADLVAQTTTAVLASKAAPADPDTVPETATSAEDAVSFKELREHLRDAMASLPEADRGLVEAIYDEGLSMGEYGNRIGKSRSTVCRHHARILRDLGKQLRDPPLPRPP
ncbi:MAG: sigma-70 family RNA polymerase sigma factor [Nannocystaceae bacterium]|nr:sigma-70 family RNA polymerase sigma factor [Nannocystaceae bacterium]